MKKIIIIWLSSFYAIIAFTQPRISDSLKLLLQKEKRDSSRVLLLGNLGASYVFEKPEVGLSYAQQGLELARSIKYKSGEAICLNILGALYRMTGNYTTGINYHLNALKIYEQLNDQPGISMSYFGIATNYEDQGDDREAIVYYYKSKSMIESLKYTGYLGGLYSNMGLCYVNLRQLDSALKYEQNAYALEINTAGAPLVLARLGNIHAQMGNYAIAQNFYHMGIPVATDNSDYNALNEIFYGISKLFQNQQQYDSCIYYAKKALFTAQEMGNPGAVSDACSILSTSYKNTHVTDSAFKYLELSTTTKDTLITQDKLKQQQLLAFEEKNRQQEIANERIIVKEKRKANIQYAGISIAVICLLILFLLLSRSIIINAKWVRFLGILSLLIIFEFINLIIHPYLAYWTNDSPVLMLLTLVIIGAMLIPLHHRIEKWIIEKMVQKNKRVRLINAKKIIASMESDSGTTDAL